METIAESPNNAQKSIEQVKDFRAKFAELYAEFFGEDESDFVRVRRSTLLVLRDELDSLRYFVDSVRSCAQSVKDSADEVYDEADSACDEADNACESIKAILDGED